MVCPQSANGYSSIGSSVSGVGLDDAIRKRREKDARDSARAESDKEWAAKAAEQQELYDKVLRIRVSTLMEEFVDRAARLAEPLPLGYYYYRQNIFRWVSRKWVDHGVRGWFWYHDVTTVAVLTDTRLVRAWRADQDRILTTDDVGDKYMRNEDAGHMSRHHSYRPLDEVEIRLDDWTQLVAAPNRFVPPDRFVPLEDILAQFFTSFDT